MLGCTVLPSSRSRADTDCIVCRLHFLPCITCDSILIPLVRYTTVFTITGYEVKNIDGIGRILGQSSPLSTRTGPYVDSLGQTQLPISAGMEFDVLDVVRTHYK
jgi:hypothetical protein